MIKLKIDIFDQDSIQKSILDIEDLKDLVQEEADVALVKIANEAMDKILLYSPPGWSGDYIKSHHVHINPEKHTALIWNDVRAETPYDEKVNNPLDLRASWRRRASWIGEQYASAVEYGEDAGWPLWSSNPNLSKGYQPYQQGTKFVVENYLPTIRAEFSLD